MGHVRVEDIGSLLVLKKTVGKKVECMLHICILYRQQRSVLDGCVCC